MGGRAGTGYRRPMSDIAYATLSKMLTETASGSKAVTLADAAVVYDELRVIAKALFDREKPGQTIQATALLHNAWIKLYGSPTPPAFKDQQHLINTFRLVMKRLLIDRSRRGKLPAGGQAVEPGMDAAVSADFGNAPVEDVNAALDKLRGELPLYADVVELKCYCGLTEDQIAYIMGIGEATVRRYWKSARTWLHAELAAGATSGADQAGTPG